VKGTVATAESRPPAFALGRPAFAGRTRRESRASILSLRRSPKVSGTFSFQSLFH